MTHAYDDIINLPHHRSSYRRPMSMHDRAAQFSPFAALSGYNDEVCEAGRRTENRICLEESELAALDRKLEILIGKMNARPQTYPEVRLTRFQPDARKEGGSYEKLAGCVKRIDLTERKLIFTDRREVPVDGIIEMELTGENSCGEDSP